MSSMKNKVEDEIVQALRLVDKVSKKEQIDYFIAGATARDIVFWNMHGVKLARATTDVDVAVCLKDWTSYEKLKKSFLNQHGVRAEEQATHRVVFKSRPIDLIPYGVIAKENMISWPPRYETQIDITGFSEAFTSLQKIHIDSETIVNFVSIPGMVVLKLISWMDNPSARGKDIYDLAFVLKNYDKINPEAKLFEENDDLLQDKDFDFEQAWCQILGRDITNEFSPEICKKLSDRLSQELSKPEESRLMTKMLLDSSESLDKNIAYIKALNKGLSQI